MFEQIIVPLDCSRLAEAALPYVEELGAKMGSEIVLLTVFESEDAKELENYLLYIAKIEAATKHYAGKYFEGQENREVKVTKATRTGNPAEGILEYTRGYDFPLIVMASHGRSGVSRWAVGSVADKVVRFGNGHPVMLIRAMDTHADIRDKRLLKQALVPLDGSFESEAVIPYIGNIAYKLDMELTLFQVVPDAGLAKTDAEAYLNETCVKVSDLINVPVNYRVGVGNVAESIIDFADEQTFDMVAMSTRGMNRNNPFSLGSVAQKVFLGGNTPLLLIKK